MNDSDRIPRLRGATAQELAMTEHQLVKTILPSGRYEVRCVDCDVDDSPRICLDEAVADRVIAAHLRAFGGSTSSS